MEETKTNKKAKSKKTKSKEKVENKIKENDTIDLVIPSEEVIVSSDENKNTITDNNSSNDIDVKTEVITDETNKKDNKLNDDNKSDKKSKKITYEEMFGYRWMGYGYGGNYFT